MSTYNYYNLYKSAVKLNPRPFDPASVVQKEKSVMHPPILGHLWEITKEYYDTNYRDLSYGQIIHDYFAHTQYDRTRNLNDLLKYQEIVDEMIYQADHEADMESGPSRYKYNSIIRYIKDNTASNLPKAADLVSMKHEANLGNTKTAARSVSKIIDIISRSIANKIIDDTIVWLNRNFSQIAYKKYNELSKTAYATLRKSYNIADFIDVNDQKFTRIVRSEDIDTSALRSAILSNRSAIDFRYRITDFPLKYAPEYAGTYEADGNITLLYDFKLPVRPKETADRISYQEYNEKCKTELYKDMEKFVYYIKGLVRHEITHFVQDITNPRDEAKYTDMSLKYLPRDMISDILAENDVPSNMVTTEARNKMLYFLRNKEIEAWAEEALAKSKFRKQDLNEVLLDNLAPWKKYILENYNRRYNRPDLTKNYETAIGKIFDRIIEIQKQYLVKKRGQKFEVA